MCTMDKKPWESQLIELVGETYAKQGHEKVIIMIGSTLNEEIVTQVCLPSIPISANDIGILAFAMNNHLHSQVNDAVNGTKK